jgi:hypothetical protein
MQVEALSWMEKFDLFKVKPGGRISREFTGYHSDGVNTVQDSAWMDESIMLIWIDQILVPYVATRPAGVEPEMILDTYRCHSDMNCSQCCFIGTHI